MTAMDKKIKELNEKLGRKTGVDFKESIVLMSKELYKNKPYFYGTVAGTSLFVLTSTGLFASIGAAVVVGFGYNLYKKEGK
jgi:hypothetical protein